MHAERGDSGELVRSQAFDADGPLELDVGVTAGHIEFVLGEARDTEDTLVEVRKASGAQPGWADSAAGVLNWVGELVGGQAGADLAGASTDPVRQTRIEKVGPRLLVRGPKAPPPMGPPLRVTVHAPHGSSLRVRSRFAAVTVTGPAGRVDVDSGTADVRLERADDSTTVRTSGSGAIDIDTLAGPGTLTTSGGPVRLNDVSGSVLVRTGSGTVSAGAVSAGTVEVISGSGDVRAGIADGVAAEIDLSSGSGTVHSELDVDDTPPPDAVPVTVRARSGSGTVLVTRA